MALHFQTHSPIFSSHPPPPHLSLSRNSFKTHNPNSLFPTSQSQPTNTTPLTLPRKLLCRPLFATSQVKYGALEEKYGPPQVKYGEYDYKVRKVSADAIKELVQGERKVPLVIGFYATWCGPCILMAQLLESLSVEYEGTALVVKVDTDDEYEFARDMQVRGLPTLYFVSPDPDKNAIRTEGLIGLELMRKILDEDM